MDVADGSAADRERQAGLPKLMFLNVSLARNGPLATRTHSAARLVAIGLLSVQAVLGCAVQERRSLQPAHMPPIGQ
jgi:hypothetical protein